MKPNLFALATLICAAVRNEFDGVGGGGGGAAVADPTAWKSEPGMTAIDIRINGVAGIKYAQPATTEKYDELAKTVGRCLADACSKHLFHSVYGDIRAGVTEALVKAGHGTPRLYATAKKIIVTEVFEGEGDAKKLTGYVDEKGKTYKADTEISVEADTAFFNRICAEKEVEPSHFQTLIQEVADATPFDPSRKQRSAGPRKIAATYIAAAQGIIDAGADVIAGATQQLSELLERPLDTSDAETRLMVLATAIADNELREKRERDAALKAKYTSFGQG